MIVQRSLPIVTEAAIPGAKPLHLVRAGDEQALASLLADHRDFLRDQGFRGEAGQFTLIPGGAVFCVGSERAGDATAFGGLGRKLPDGQWALMLHDLDEGVREMAVLGFCMGAYRYRVGATPRASEVVLVVEGGVSARTKALAQANWLGRDLINAPANLLGPQELALAAQEALEARGAQVEIVRGEMLNAEYPCLAAVGAGSERPSAVVIARWKKRDGAPRVSLVGKGVCFDTGGYDIKPSAGMLRMKKDMGGAALMLAVMCAAIDADLDVDLELRLGCVENSVSGHAMRPGDVLLTRSGKYVEIGNTDAEGRLVLCDLLTEASETTPDILIDAATLTGAARVALGPDLPALFSNDDNLADLLLESGKIVSDAMWRMPLWHGYDAWLDSPIADLRNVTSKSHAGAITAALYLQRFVPTAQKWAHIDTYAWNDADSDGRPAGGETLCLRALTEAISRLGDIS